MRLFTRSRKPRTSPEPLRPPGFTLIEVVVVISIVGLLAALLLMAVQRVREAGRHAQCVNNLRQIGIAMNSYLELHRMMPPGQLLTGRIYSANYMSEFTFLLPFLDQQPLYSALNMDFANIEAPSFPTMENRTVRDTRLNVFLCPSDGEARHLNNYRVNRGRFGAKPGHRYDGPFSIGVLPTAAAFRDGLSRTAIVSERLGGSFRSGSFDERRDLKQPLLPKILIQSDEQLIGLCATEPALSWVVASGRYWMYGGFFYTSYNHNGSPNDPRPSCFQGIIEGGDIGLHPPRSYHPGSVNVLFGGGNVETIQNSIHPSVWTALGTYDAGDLGDVPSN